MRPIIILSLLLVFSTTGMSQKTDKPNYGLKSPSSAEILWVDFGSHYTEVCVKIRNEIENGFFCIDKNTRLIKPDSTFVMLRSIEGLPFCPDIYKFKKVGEEVTVRFVFPATGTLPWFSVIEECSGGCFKFLGVVADTAVNSDIENAYSYEFEGYGEKSCAIFSDLIEKYDALNIGIEGLLYVNVIEFYWNTGKKKEAGEWYHRMLNSNAPDLKLYLDNLKSKGISM